MCASVRESADLLLDQVDSRMKSLYSDLKHSNSNGDERSTGRPSSMKSAILEDIEGISSDVAELMSLLESTPLFSQITSESKFLLELNNQLMNSIATQLEKYDYEHAFLEEPEWEIPTRRLFSSKNGDLDMPDSGNSNDYGQVRGHRDKMAFVAHEPPPVPAMPDFSISLESMKMLDNLRGDNKEETKPKEETVVGKDHQVGIVDDPDENTTISTSKLATNEGSTRAILDMTSGDYEILPVFLRSICSFDFLKSSISELNDYILKKEIREFEIASLEEANFSFKAKLKFIMLALKTANRIEMITQDGKTVYIVK